MNMYKAFQERMSWGANKPHRPRGVTSDWSTWERLTEDVLPAPDTQLMDYMAFFYSRRGFASYRATVEGMWQRPFLDSVLSGLDRMPVCDSDAFWLEASYSSFLYKHERKHHQFVNSTRLVTQYFTPSLTATSERVKRVGFLPNGFGLLWWYLDNGTFDAFRSLYTDHPLAHFRMDWRGLSMKRSSRDLSCRGLDLIRSLPGPTASIQLNSAVPNWVFETPSCRDKLPNKSLPYVKHKISTR